MGTGLGDQDKVGVVAASWVLGRRHLDIFRLFDVHGKQLGLELWTWEVACKLRMLGSVSWRLFCWGLHADEIESWRPALVFSRTIAELRGSLSGMNLFIQFSMVWIWSWLGLKLNWSRCLLSAQI